MLEQKMLKEFAHYGNHLINMYSKLSKYDKLEEVLMFNGWARDEEEEEGRDCYVYCGNGDVDADMTFAYLASLDFISSVYIMEYDLEESYPELEQKGFIYKVFFKIKEEN